MSVPLLRSLRGQNFMKQSLSYVVRHRQGGLCQFGELAQPPLDKKNLRAIVRGVVMEGPNDRI
jgi:hypothetical protein